MSFSSELIIHIFKQSIREWHADEHVLNPYKLETLEYLLYKNNQTDTIQWHEEDEIRRPDLPVERLILIKRNIDRLNQIRTDTVEKIDDLIYEQFRSIALLPSAQMNSETPAWLVDRMSILELKIWHMQEQTQRNDVAAAHISGCQTKLDTLLEQRKDMSTCLNQLLEDIRVGKRYFKVYRQMKMYNDQTLNPSLYGKTSG